MATPGRSARNRAARSFRQLMRFHHVINADKVFGTHRSSRYLLNNRYVCRGVIAISSADARAVNLSPVQLALAHHHYAHRNDSLQTPKKEQKLTSLLCSVLTF